MHQWIPLNYFRQLKHECIILLYFKILLFPILWNLYYNVTMTSTISDDKSIFSNKHQDALCIFL